MRENVRSIITLKRGKIRAYRASENMTHAIGTMLTGVDLESGLRTS